MPRCFVSQRYWKMKAIHNFRTSTMAPSTVVLYPKDTEKWKQFTTYLTPFSQKEELFCIPKILKNESNSQRDAHDDKNPSGCFVSQRYWKMKAIHNITSILSRHVVLFCIPKILKNESNSQHSEQNGSKLVRCFVSQRYWKMKAIHNYNKHPIASRCVVLYPKDTEKWKQFTTETTFNPNDTVLFCIPKILKNESNSQQISIISYYNSCCFVSQRYWKMKAIHNLFPLEIILLKVVLYPKDTEKWKQFTTQLHKVPRWK